MSSAVRLVALALFVAPLFAAFAPSAVAGTAEAPEITDDANDQGLTPAGEDLEETACPLPPQGCLFTRTDILKAWIANETATQIVVHVELATAPQGQTQFTYVWQFHATAIEGGDDIHATVTGVGGGTANSEPTPTENVVSVVRTDTVLSMTIDKSIYGAGATGLTNLEVTAQARLALPAPGNVLLATDTALAAAGTSYVFTGGSTVPSDPFDTDGDGLNDTAFEEEYFGDLNQTGSGDPDGDGLNNTQEQALGTDPTMADTDGDGVPDGTEVANGTDPLDPLDPPTTPTDTNTTVPPTDTNTTSGPGQGGNGTTDERDFLGKLSDASTGYLMYSGIGCAVVIVFALIGRFGRWGL